MCHVKEGTWVRIDGDIIQSISDKRVFFRLRLAFCILLFVFPLPFRQIFSHYDVVKRGDRNVTIEMDAYVCLCIICLSIITCAPSFCLRFIMTVALLIRCILFYGLAKDVFLTCSYVPEYSVRWDFMSTVDPWAVIHHTNISRQFLSDFDTVEVMHSARNGYTSPGFWMYVVRGSNMTLNIGKTVGFRIHDGAINHFLGQCETDCESKMLERAKIEYDTVHFTHHQEEWLDKWCSTVFVEIVWLHNTSENKSCLSNIRFHKEPCICDTNKPYLNCNNNASVMF